MTAPIDIDCPTCKSMPGNYCTSASTDTSGRALVMRLMFHHADRVDAAARAEPPARNTQIQAEVRDLSKALDIAIRAKIDADDQIAKLSADLAEAAGKIEALNKARQKLNEARSIEVNGSWSRGFALALISIWECQHDDQLIKQLLVANNFTLASFDGIGLAEGHLEIIRKAADR
jgi:hypothetical protein